MKFIAVTSDHMSIPELVVTLKSIEPYIDQIILREKSKTAEEIVVLCNQLKSAAFNVNKLILHRYPDLAAKNDITHVHFPGNNSSISTTRAKFPSLTIGQSVHSVKEAKLAEEEGAHYILYGHIFQSTCKPGLQPRGIVELKALTAAVNIPVIAIGGIQPTHLNALQGTNIAGFAVMSSIFHAENPVTAAKLYAKERKSHWEKSFI